MTRPGLGAGPSENYGEERDKNKKKNNKKKKEKDKEKKEMGQEQEQEYLLGVWTDFLSFLRLGQERFLLLILGQKRFFLLILYYIRSLLVTVITVIVCHVFHVHCTANHYTMR